ncbi:TadE/TadG family type IV pilus assembly protein [Kitasatospora sp. NPDC096147]|uniref:TadE/TadG family type IV pilus assembly protein n=1 Tax=Kitasatospora sp. NPDC096147 TaxID=3364093 RepID=UPI0037F2F06B
MTRRAVPAVRAGAPRRGRRHPDRGSAALELALLAPVLVVFVLLAVAAGRIQTTGGVVDAAARSGARAASLARTVEGGQQAAADAVAEALRGQGVVCQNPETPRAEYSTMDTADGPLVTVTVRVSCRVPLADLMVGWPSGGLTMHGTFTSVVDRYRGTS